MPGRRSVRRTPLVAGFDDRCWENLCQSDPAPSWLQIEPHVARTLARVSSISECGFESAAYAVQEEAGSNLIDLTMPEAREETLGIALRQLLETRDSLTEAAEQQLSLSRALQHLRTCLRSEYKAYRAWLSRHRKRLEGSMPESHLNAVGSIWEGEGPPPPPPTEYGRRQARALQKRLDESRYVSAFRRKLRIPEEGFRTSDEAARWLYDRRPDFPNPWFPSSGRRFKPYCGRLRSVMALSTAEQEVLRKHDLSHEWGNRIALYLLRGELEPLPRKRQRERPKASLHAHLIQLADRYGNTVAADVYNCGLTEDEADEVIQSLPPSTGKEDISIALADLANQKNSWVEEDEMVAATQIARIKYRARHGP